MESVLQEVAEEMAGRAVVGKVYPSDGQLFKKFGVRGVPTLFVMRNGKIKMSFWGTSSKDVLMKVLKQHGPSS